MLYQLFSIFIVLWLSHGVQAQEIAALKVQRTKIDEAWSVSYDSLVRKKTWQEVCEVLHLPPTSMPNGRWCETAAGNSVYIPFGEVCSDGSLVIPIHQNRCSEQITVCPNPSWVLSADKQHCYRKEQACWQDLSRVSEVKLLAAIAYGEAHWSNVYEEIAGIASAIIRRRDAEGFESVNFLVKKKRHFSYVVYNKNERFVQLMCGDKKHFKKAYDAANNALNYGIDYANGGCYWDGYDLKTSGVKHYKYRQGFRYSNPSHNIFSAPEPSHIKVKGNKGSYYDTIYISTAAQGKTIFWKLDKKFLEGEGVKQCR